MESELPDWAKKVAVALMGVEGDLPPTTHDIARALVGAERRGIERAAKVAERDVDWSAFGKRDVGQWDGGPDSLRDYRLGIVSGRAIAAAIRQIGGEGC